MTGLEYVLAAVFATGALMPLAMAARWEQRLRRARAAHAEGDAEAPPARGARSAEAARG